MKKYISFLFLLWTNLVYAQSQPNIVFILADDLGYGDLSCYGAKDIQTPYIDALANQSTVFTKAYANSTVCSPSRAAILLGDYPDRVGVPGVIRDMPDNTWGNLRDDLVSLPQQLEKSGYHTALIGKWHLGYQSPDLPNDRGFKHFKGYVGDMMDDYYTHLRAGVNWMRENKKEIHPKGHATDIFTKWTTEYLKERKKEKQPFFLFLTYNAPHDPVQPPKEWLDKVKEREPNATSKRQKLIALIEHLDNGVGKVLQTLDKEGLSKNTIVVFTSDNGGALGYGASNAPFSGGKGDMLEGGIRVPCLVRYPKQVKRFETGFPILLMDFYPTLVESAIHKPAPKGNAQSFLPLIENRKAVQQSERYMFWVRREGHKFGGRDYYAVSDGKYKLLQNTPFEPYEFYNLSEDKKEQAPIKFNEKKKVLWKKLMKHIQKSGQISWQ